MATLQMSLFDEQESTMDERIIEKLTEMEAVEIKRRGITKQWEGVNKWVWLVSMNHYDLRLDISRDDYKDCLKRNFRHSYESAIKKGWPPSALDNWMETKNPAKENQPTWGN